MKEVKFTSNIQLQPAQRPIVEVALKNNSGVIIAPSGSGKTIIGLQIIVDSQLPALILVNRKQLLEQWVERIQMFLEIQKKTSVNITELKRKKVSKLRSQ